MCGRQCVGMVAEMVLAEPTGVVAKVEQELGERRRAGPQIGRAAGQLRRDHAGAQRVHAGEEGIAPGGAALLGVVVHKPRAVLTDFVDVRRLADHQALVVDARLHPADVITHDEEDVGFWLLRDCRCACHHCRGGSAIEPSQICLVTDMIKAPIFECGKNEFRGAPCVRRRSFHCATTIRRNRLS